MVPNSPRMPRLGRKGVSGDVGTKKTKKDEETKTGFFVLKKLLPYALRHKGALGLSLLLAIAAVVMQLYIPILFGKAIDHVVAVGKVDFAGMWVYLCRILFFAVAAALATWWMNLLNNRITYGILRDLRSQAMAHIQKLPLAYLDKHKAQLRRYCQPYRYRYRCYCRWAVLRL